MSKSARIRTIPGQFGKLFGAHYLRNRVAPRITPRIPVFLLMNSTSFFISVGVNAAGKSPQLARSLRLTDYLPSCSNNSPKSGEGLFDLKRVSCSEVTEVLTAMPFNKAPRYDRIPLFVIKDCLPLHTSDFNKTKSTPPLPVLNSLGL